MERVKLNIALVGNPNSGKSTVFNLLTGLNQKVANFPGVTVDKRVGFATLTAASGETIDTLEQVRPAVERAFRSGIPYCLNVNVRGVRSPFTQWQLSGKK